MAHSATTSAELSRYIDSKSPNICIVKFGNNKTCPPCRTSHPIFHHAADTHSKKCNFVDVDLGAAGSLGQSYKIQSMPTFIYFKDGIEVKRITGAQDLDVTIGAFVQQYGKTVFETSSGKSLGLTSSTTTTSPPAATTTSSGRQQRANNPWARKDFNPAAQMRSNAGIEEKAATSPPPATNTDGVELSEAPAGMVCKDGVCYFPSAADDAQQKPKSVCQSCEIM